MPALELFLSAALAASASPDDWASETPLLTTEADGTVHVLRLASPDPDAQGRGPDQRPALLVVSGLDGRQSLGPAIAGQLREHLLGEHRELLRRNTVYVVAELDPGSAEAWRQRRPRVDFGGQVVAGDRDLDRRRGEDGGEDLNGDGLITQMRVLDPPARSGLVARYVLDPDDDRLLKEADADKGEIARYALAVEGVDDDGDGQWAEDGLGGEAGSGLDLDRDFPALWPQLEDGTAAWPLSCPQTRALADWMLARPNVVCVLTFGRHDNLAKVPESGKYDDTNRVPLGIEKEDALLYEKVGELFQELTGITGAAAEDRAGSFHHWAYAHLGLASFSTPGWARADWVKSEDEAEEEKKPEGERREGRSPAAAPEKQEAAPPEVIEVAGQRIELTPAGVAAAMSAMENASEAEQRAMFEAFGSLSEEQRNKFRALAEGGGAAEPATSAPTPGPKKRGASKSDDGQWLKASDEAGGVGFVDWTEVEHPQLGTVEVGGFVPGYRAAPPRDDFEGWIRRNHAFVARLLPMLPDLRVDEPQVERLGAGLWRVRLRLGAEGEMPTRTAMGVKTRRLHGAVCVLDTDPDELIAGSKVQRVERLMPGEHQDLEWTLHVADGSTLGLDLRCAEYGDRHFDVRFVEEGR